MSNEPLVGQAILDLEMIDHARFDIDHARKTKRAWRMWQKIVDRFQSVLQENASLDAQVKELAQEKDDAWKDFDKATSLLGWSDGEKVPKTVTGLVQAIQLQAGKDAAALEHIVSELLKRVADTTYTLALNDPSQLLHVIDLMHQDDKEAWEKERDEITQSFQGEIEQHKKTIDNLTVEAKEAFRREAEAMTLVVNLQNNIMARAEAHEEDRAKRRRVFGFEWEAKRGN